MIYKTEYEVSNVKLCVFTYDENTKEIDITQTYGHYGYNPFEITYTIISLTDSELVLEAWDDREDEMVTCRFNKVFK